LTDALVRNFRTLARYNALANRRLYEACARLPDDERKKRRLAFFGSIHGTLNHIMIGDRIWLARFSGEEIPSTNLDAILYEDFGRLREARDKEDSRIEAFAAGIDERFLKGKIRYVNNQGRTLEDPVGRALLQPPNPSPRPSPRYAQPDRSSTSGFGSPPRHSTLTGEGLVLKDLLGDYRGVLMGTQA
jgi:uncharacterized damage-inducible protein DinB